MVTRQTTIRIVLAIGGDTTVALRDRALLLLYFTGAFRRSEIVSLRVSDLEWLRDGVVVRVGRNAAPDNRWDEYIFVGCAENDEACPVASLRRYLSAACIDSGPVFRRATSAGTLVGTRRIDERKLYQDGPAGPLMSSRSVSAIAIRHSRTAGVDPATLPKDNLRQRRVWRLHSGASR